MTSEIFDCSMCGQETTHIKESNRSIDESLVISKFTSAILFAIPHLWKCSKCGNTLIQ
jgi:ribosomal protein L37AE/L43A